MAKRGGQIGNENAAKAKQFEHSLRRCLARKGGSVDKGLDLVATNLVNAAVDDGEQWAISMIADRIEGKVKERIEHSTDPESPFTMLLSSSETLRAKLRASTTEKAE